MKKCFLLIPCLALSATLAHSQTQSGTQSGTSSGTASGQTGTGTTVQQQSGVTGQTTTQPGATIPGAAGGVTVNESAGATTTVIPGGDTNRLIFGGTNQIRFGGTNTGTLINERSGANLPPQVPFGTTNGALTNTRSGVNLPPQVPFGTFGTNAGVPTNNTPLAGSGTIQDPSGAQAGSTNKVRLAQDAMFAQQLSAALARGGATKVLFPRTGSTITIVNQNGSILLQGFVSSEVERQEIEARVRNAAGVTAVNNQLRIAAPGQNRAVSPLQNSTQPGDTNRQLFNP
jgi:hypothetical protein